MLNYKRVSLLLKEKCAQGRESDIDDVIAMLDEQVDLPTTKLIDFHLGQVTNSRGIKRIEFFLFNGTQIQRNYCTLFFARRNDWGIVNKAYKAGLIDYKQAYSR